MEKERTLFKRENNNMLEASNNLLTSSGNSFKIILKEKSIRTLGPRQ